MGFKKIRDERVVEFTVTTKLQVTSYRGTDFTPNHCQARVFNGEIVSVSLALHDENGWGVDDPAGPHGAELAADFGGGQFLQKNRASLPKIAQQALVAVETAIR